MGRRIPDLRDHPVLAIMVGFLVLAVVAVPTLLLLGEPSQGPPGGDRPASPSASATAGGADGIEGDLTISAARPVAEVASQVVSQDDAFPGYRAALLTMAPQVDAQAARRQGEDGSTLSDAEAAAAAGWVEVYALRPDDTDLRAPGQSAAQERIGILVRSGGGGVRTRNIIDADPDRPQPQQAVAASYDAGTVVWWEVAGSEDGGGLTFVLYAWSTDGGETTELFRSEPSEDGSGPPNVPGIIGPVVRGDTALWARVSDSPAGGPASTDVMGCQVDDCEPQVVREDAAYPTAGPAGFALLARDTESADAEVISLVEVGADLQQRGEPVALPADVSTTSGFAGSRSGYVLLETPPNEPTRAVLLDDRDDDAPQVVIGPPAGGFVNAVAGERLVAWGFAGAADEPVGGYAFDRGTGDLLSLGDSSSRYGVAVAQGRVGFQVQADRDDGLPGQRVALLP